MARVRSAALLQVVLEEANIVGAAQPWDWRAGADRILVLISPAFHPRR
jgi:hypothetical protein